MSTQETIEFLKQLHKDWQYKQVHYVLDQEKKRKLEDIMQNIKLLHDDLLEWKE